MDLKNTLDKINDNRSQIEACFVMCLWKDLSRYDDYRTVNTGKDKTLQNEDACFYFSIGRSIRELGHQSIDNVTIANFLQGKPFITERFEEMGGWRTCQDMLSLVSPENTEAYFDQIAKMNTLSIMCKKYDELFTDVGRFNKATNEDVYNTFELLNNSVSLTTGHSSKIEDLTVDESYIQECNAGMDVGLNYGKGLPLLNYLTCGIPVGDMYLMAGHSGVGKALEINTPVLTVNGFKPMKDIEVGDMVISEDGNPYLVTGTFPQGFRDGYRVTFEDGTHVDCDGEHLWKFKTFSDQRRGRSWKVDTLNNIIANYKFKKSNGTFNLSIPVMSAVKHFNNETKLPIPPYALGALIGDACLKYHPITFTNPEMDVVNKVEQELAEFGCFHHYQNNLQHNFVSNGNFGYWPCGRPINELARRIKELGLNITSRDKFIPQMYLYASEDERLELLRGLIDTDGNVNCKGAVSFSTVSERLAKDVQELIWSLGYRCSFKLNIRKDKSYTYNIRIYAKTDELFTSEKHKKRYMNRRKNIRIHDYNCLKIVKIEKLQEPVEMKCISVDSPEHTYICGDYIVTHNTSVIFETMVIPLSEQGIKVAIISNEMVSKAYKNLLLIHVLTRDLNYWKITRKKLKLGHFSDDELEMLRKAAEIIKIKYNNIQFIKMFENESSKVCQYIKRLARTGTKAIVYDTMKADDSSTTDGQMWQALLQNSRKIFNVVSKEQVACVCTFQLALHSTNQRWLDATCLSNSKQIKEVVSELVMCRKLWQDEYTGQKYDCKPWHRNKDNPKIKEYITLDKDKTYVVFFLNKTRNDEDGQTIIAEFNGAWNNWRELGYCTIVNDHKAGS